MANGQEELEREPAEGSAPEAKEAVEEHKGMYPVDSSLDTLDPSLRHAFEEMGSEAEQYAIPDISLPEIRRQELANKSRIFKFFYNEVRLRLNRDSKVIEERNKAKREGVASLSGPEDKVLVNRLRAIMREAWEATKTKFDERIPPDWGEKMKEALNANLGVVEAEKKPGGIPEKSVIFSPDKEIGSASSRRQLGYIRNLGMRGSAEKIKKISRDQRKAAAEKNEISVEDDKEPKEEAA